jgi:hypothetical protein
VAAADPPAPAPLGPFELLANLTRLEELIVRVATA